MSTDQHTLTPEHPAYPPALRHWLGANAPPTLTARGNLAILQHRALALFSSSQCPAALILRAHDLADQLRQQGREAVIFRRGPAMNQMRSVRVQVEYSG